MLMGEGFEGVVAADYYFPKNILKVGVVVCFFFKKSDH